jgi:N-acyl-D-amino-acid deacylase
VRQQHVITLPFAIRAATSLPATIAGFHDRGLVKTGDYADLVIFDYNTIGSPATYAHPSVYSTGIQDVLVNGKFAVEDGKPTHALAGRVLWGPATEKK